MGTVNIDVALQSTLEEVKALAQEIKTLASSGSGSVIKSVQRGIITIASGKTEGTATISSVNTSKAVVLFGGSIWGTNDSSDYSIRWDARLVLSSSTKVTATRAYANSTATVPYQVLEFV